MEGNTKKQEAVVDEDLITNLPPYPTPAQTASSETLDRLQPSGSAAVAIETTVESQEPSSSAQTAAASSLQTAAAAAAAVISQLSRYGYSASASSFYSSNDDDESDASGRLFQVRADGRLVRERTSTNEEVRDTTPSSKKAKARVSSADASRLFAVRRSSHSMAPRSSHVRRREKVWKAFNQTVAVTGSRLRPMHPHEEDAEGQQPTNPAPGVDHYHNDVDVENPRIETLDVSNKGTKYNEGEGNHEIATKDNSKQQQHSQKKTAPQYNLSNRKSLILRAAWAKERKQYGWGSFGCCLCRPRANPATLTSLTFGAVSCLGFSLNQQVLNYLHWTFRSSFFSVIMSFTVVFLIICFCSAAILYWIGQYHPTCAVGGVDFAATESFNDLFLLTWTTFAVTGIGVVHSPLSSVEPNIHKCAYVNAGLAWEAFFGLVYCSFFAAIIFAKISRIQSVAQVVFSTPIVIRYGNGVSLEQDNVNKTKDMKNINNHDTIAATTTTDDSAISKENLNVTRSKQLSDASLTDMLLLQDTERLPCPFLEFRIANRLWQVDGGELLDSMVNIVASIDPSQACHTLHGGMQKRRRRNRKGGRQSTSQKSFGVQRQEKQQELESQGRHNIDREKYLSHASALLSNYIAGSLGTADSHHKDEDAGTLEPIAATSTTTAPEAMMEAFEEDPKGNLAPSRIFAKLNVKTSEHPFFERVWTIRHELDDKSPLLRSAAREMVRANGGFWPVELNSAEGVRSAIHFDQILVSFTGICNADVTTVYAQHVYEWVDLIVGYRFANMMYPAKPTTSGTATGNHSKAANEATTTSNQKHPPSRAPSQSHSGRHIRNRRRNESDSNNNSSDDMNYIDNDDDVAGKPRPEWCVDLRLINDVREQAGGGGEPFLHVVPERIRDHVADMLIL